MGIAVTDQAGVHEHADGHTFDVVDRVLYVRREPSVTDKPRQVAAYAEWSSVGWYDPPDEELAAAAPEPSPARVIQEAVKYFLGYSVNVGPGLGAWVIHQLDEAGYQVLPATEDIGPQPSIKAGMPKRRRAGGLAG